MKRDRRFIGVAAGVCLIAAVLVSTSAAPIVAQGNGAVKLDCLNQVRQRRAGP